MYRYLLTSLLLLFSVHAMACSCYSIASYCQTTNNHDGPIFIGVKVSSYEIDTTIIDLYEAEKGMEFRIIKTIRGQASSDTISVWTDFYGASCKTPTSRFDIGDTLVLNLNKDTFSYEDVEDHPDYQLPSAGCSTPWLMVRNDSVRGYINRKDRAISFEEFTYSGACCPEGQPCYHDIPECDFQIAPNPAKDQFFIRFRSNFATQPKVELYNMNGLHILTQSITDKKNKLDLDGISPGMYIVKIKTYFEVCSKVIVKQ